MKLAEVETRKYGVHFEMTLRDLSERDVDDIAKQLGGQITKRELVDRGFRDDQIKYKIEHSSREEAETAWEQLKMYAEHIKRARLVK